MKYSHDNFSVTDTMSCKKAATEWCYDTGEGKGSVYCSLDMFHTVAKKVLTATV